MDAAHQPEPRTKSDAAAAEEGARGHWWTVHRKLAAGILLFVAIAAILPPWLNINRFRRDIAAGISGSLGRPVRLDHVGLRLLPAPAFTIDNFVVGEDAAFGAEPVVRAASVVATLHISSLWRGRLEFATISLDEPSINVVRNARGRWNISSILLQAAQIATAPTAQKRAGGLPRFPYIEAQNARVNVKMGDEKTPLSFTDAKFALWLSGPGQWQVRMEARPMRTDMDLSDTGTIKVEGQLGRAATISAVPVQLRAEWKNAQLGDATRMLTGKDMGWRGGLDATADVGGAAGDAHLVVRASVTGVRREEIVPDRRLDLQVDCAARATGNFSSVSAIDCSLPLGGGQLALSGAIADVKTGPRPQLELLVRDVPAAEMLNVLRHASNAIAPDLAAEGTLNGAFGYGSAGDNPVAGAPVGSGSASGGSAIRWRGGAVLPTLTVRSARWAGPLVLSGIRLGSDGLAASGPAAPVPVASRPSLALKAARAASSKSGKAKVLSRQVEPESGIALQPVDLPLGGPTPALLEGTFDGNGYSFHASGSATLARLLELDSSLHFFGGVLPGLQPMGTADLDLRLQGPWEMPVAQVSFLNPGNQRPARQTALTGVLQLKGARLLARSSEGGSAGDAATMPTSPPPGTIGIAAARVQFAADAVRWDRVVANYGGARVEGEASQPLVCPASDAAEACPVAFDLSVAAVDMGKVAAALSSGAPAKKSLLNIFSREDTAAASWPTARGTLRMAALSVGPWVMRSAVANLSLKGDLATLESLSARTLEGTLEAKGTLQGGGAAWRYEVDASLADAQLAAAAAMFRQEWGTGSGDAHCALRMEGADKAALTQSAQGNCEWTLRKGTLNLATTSTLDSRGESVRSGRPAIQHEAFQQWKGQGTVGQGRITIVSSEAANLRGKVAVSGTVGLDRSADVTWGGEHFTGRIGAAEDKSGDGK